jgi:glycine cleavage system transcriptional repressor
MNHLLVTAVGPDRPGIVGDLSAHLHAAGANIADSRMMNLRGRFALILLLDGEAPVLAALRESLPTRGRTLGLSISFAEEGATASPVRGVPYRLRTYSADQPGIVARVTEVLQQHGANIEELSTKLESAPFSGSPLFTLEALLTLPEGKPVRAVRKDLEGVCEALNCDIDLNPA